MSRLHLRSDRGAAAVEFALLFPIFAVLAMGTISAGFAFSKQINITQSAREVSRYGATLPVDPLTTAGLDTWLGRLDDAVEATAGNASSPVAGYDYRCVAYVVTGTSGAIDTTKSRRSVNGGTPQAGYCTAAPASSVPTSPGQDYAQVVITRNAGFFMIIANPTIELDALSLTPFEGKAP